MRTRAGAVAIVPMLVPILVAAGCSDDDAASPGDEDVGTSPVTSAPADSSEPAPSVGEADPTVVETTLDTSGAEPPPEVADTTTTVLVTVPETGVPGLDSDDSFCAAWSRFGGSWQVIQVAANFAPDPSVVPAMEVVAAPVVDAAYDAMFAAWPDELATERDVVADGFFGPLDRRAEAALEALDTVGAGDADLAALGAAWIEALAVRQPDDPVLTPVLGDGLQALVDAAAAEFTSQRVEFVLDPSMRITAETPLTDAYLATACPDQGALTGGEVDGG
jgi:hypothetical protein